MNDLDGFDIKTSVYEEDDKGGISGYWDVWPQVFTLIYFVIICFDKI